MLDVWTVSQETCQTVVRGISGSRSRGLAVLNEFRTYNRQSGELSLDFCFFSLFISYSWKCACLYFIFQEEEQHEEDDNICVCCCYYSISFSRMRRQTDRDNSCSREHSSIHRGSSIYRDGSRICRRYRCG